MSAASADGAGVSGLEQIVADYLRQHPDFFMRHGDLVGEMEVLHPCGRAVSLIEYQVTVLRDQSHQLRRRLQDLLVTARENEQLSERVHELTLELVACRTLPEALQTLYRALRRVADPERRLYPPIAAFAALMNGLAVTNHMEMPSTIIGKASIKPPANSIWPSSWARISGWRANDSRYFEAMMPQANAVASAPALRMMPTTHAVLV